MSRPLGASRGRPGRRGPRDSRAVSEILGLVFAFALVVSVVAVVQLAGTPVWTAGDEADHSAAVAADVATLDTAVFQTAGFDAGDRVAVESDVAYPERYLLVGPAGGAGTFRLDGSDAVTVTGLRAVGPEAVFWNGSAHTFTTGAVVYDPDYAERDEASLVVETGVSYLQNGDSEVVHRQSLVRGTTVSLVFFEGDVGSHTTGGETVPLSPVSVRTSSLPVYDAADPIRITLPTYLSEDSWRDLMADEPHARVVSYVESDDHAHVTVELEAGVRYDVRIARLGVGAALDPDPAAYAVTVEGDSAAVPTGGRETIVVRAFDRYGAPAAGATVTAVTPTPLGGTVTPIDGAGAVTDETGRIRLSYQSPADVTDVRTDTVTVRLDGAAGPGATVRVPLEVRGTAETYEVRNLAADPSPDPDPGVTPDDDFDIVGGTVVPASDFRGEFVLLGSAIESGRDDVPVSVTFVVGDATFAPADWSNVNDGRSHDFAATGEAGDGISVVASARGYLTVDSATDSPQVSVLRDGDPVPDVKGFDGQHSVEEYVAPYVSDDGRTVELADDQAIFLFELGTDNPRKNAYDMQDAVVLVTLSETDAD